MRSEIRTCQGQAVSEPYLETPGSQETAQVGQQELKPEGSGVPMLMWAGASLPPQQGTCPSESWTRHGGTSRGQVHLSSHKSVMTGTKKQSSGSHTQIQYQFLQEAFQADPQ